MATNWSPLPLSHGSQSATPPKEHGFATVTDNSAGVNVRFGTVATPTWAGHPVIPETNTEISVTHPRELAHSNNLTPVVSGEHFFEKPLPLQVSANYLRRTKAGKHYAVYTLVPLTGRETGALLNVLDEHSAAELEPPSFKLAPTYDFSHSNQNSVRDIYDYHTSLLEVVQSNPHDLKHEMFLVVAHHNWEKNGILLMSLNSHSVAPGVVGFTRLPADMAGSSLALLESTPEAWPEFKLAEADAKWPDQIKGYTGSRWEQLEEEVHAS